jgi:hypothetical protein
VFWLGTQTIRGIVRARKMENHDGKWEALPDIYKAAPRID